MATRPPKFERDAIAAIVKLLDDVADITAAPGFGIHIVHLADAESLDVIKVWEYRAFGSQGGVIL
jgi:allantoinase